MNREELPQETPRKDMMREALKHYEELATKACWHRSDIPEAIRAYYAPLPPAEGAENVTEDMYEKVEAFLQSKDIWNHPYISDRENKTGYEVTFLIAEFATLQNKPQPTAEGAGEISNAILAAAHDYDTKIRNHEEETADSDDYIAFINGAQWMREFAAQQQPTAEGAEEILDKYPHSIEYPSFVHENSAIAAMTEFATLHAQRIAEKMVSERLREELGLFYLYIDKDWALGMLTDNVDEVINGYLKSRKR